ncbi:hypothetical protein OAD05_03625 [Candidatus Pelagibacter sp.]|nr:hypothetical protein [Candidatus Pelagibacter sp.]
MKINLHENLLNLFKKQGGYLNKNLIIKKDVEKGFGIISDDDILFNKNTIFQNISSFLEIFQPKERQEMLMKILKMYKNSISMNLEDQNIGKDSIILKKFFKSVELYTNIINNYLELIAKKNEKN